LSTKNIAQSQYFFQESGYKQVCLLTIYPAVSYKMAIFCFGILNRWQNYLFLRRLANKVLVFMVLFVLAILLRLKSA